MFGDDNPDEREIKRLEDLIDYYEGLLDFLDDMVPCLGELIAMYNEGEDE